MPTRATGAPVRSRHIVEGGGHTWPGSTFEVASLAPTTQDVDATALIREAFRATWPDPG